MKAHFEEGGVLVVSGETALECLAMIAWKHQNVVLHALGGNGYRSMVVHP